jgi:hypothetical protein
MAISAWRAGTAILVRFSELQDNYVRATIMVNEVRRKIQLQLCCELINKAHTIRQRERIFLR